MIFKIENRQCPFNPLKPFYSWSFSLGMFPISHSQNQDPIWPSYGDSFWSHPAYLEAGFGWVWAQLKLAADHHNCWHSIHFMITQDYPISSLKLFQHQVISLLRPDIGNQYVKAVEAENRLGRRWIVKRRKEFDC